MSKYSYIPIFWSGVHANKGDKKEWTREDVRKIFESTKSKATRIPFTIDHPKNDLPVIGYTDHLNMRFIEDNDKAIIEVQPTDFAEEILKQVKESGRKKVSIALEPSDYSIRHIGLVEKPAVKDLPAIPFEQSEAIQFELENEDSLFMDWETAAKFRNIGNVLSSIREYIITKEGIEKANEIIDKWNINDLLETKEEQEQPQKNLFSNIEKDSSMDDNQPVNPELLKFEQENQNLKAELERLKAEQEAIRAEKRMLEFKQYLSEKLPTKVTPAIISKVLRIMTSLDNQPEYQFSEGDNQVTTTALDEFKELLHQLPDQITFNEYALDGNSGDSSDLQDAIIAEFNKSRLK